MELIADVVVMLQSTGRYPVVHQEYLQSICRPKNTCTVPVKVPVHFFVKAKVPVKVPVFKKGPTLGTCKVPVGKILRGVPVKVGVVSKVLARGTWQSRCRVKRTYTRYLALKLLSGLHDENNPNEDKNIGFNRSFMSWTYSLLTTMS